MTFLQKARNWLGAVESSTSGQTSTQHSGKESAEEQVVSREPSGQQTRQANHVNRKSAAGAAAAPTATASAAAAKGKMEVQEFFTEYGEARRYRLKEVIGKGSYGVVCSAMDMDTGEKVAIKKINNVFDHVSDATRILREIKLLRLLRHPDIVEIKHIMLPPSPREFRDIFVVFELMETDLHQVIKANDDLTPEHHQFFLYQMLRGLKYIHTAKVFHRDLKPKNILANSDCKLKVCDFGLARPSFNDMPTTIFWTDYVATRWYRAPELCGSFFAKYSPAIDIWSIGCIFAEVLLGKPLFPGRNVVHQLELITDLLGTPSADVINKVRNEKARRFLMNMKRKPGVNLAHYFPRADPSALALLKKMLSFDPADRPTCQEALADLYFTGLAQPSREPAAQPVSKLAFEFEHRKLHTDDVRDLIYREILEYHPQMLSDFLSAGSRVAAVPGGYMYPSGADAFRRQFDRLESGGKAQGPNLGQAISLPRERVREFQHEAHRYLAAQHSQAGPSGVPPPVAEHGAGDPMAVDSVQQSVRGLSIEENGYGRAPAILPQQGHAGMSQQQVQHLQHQQHQQQLAQAQGGPHQQQLKHQTNGPPPPQQYPAGLPVPGYGQMDSNHLLRSNSYH